MNALMNALTMFIIRRQFFGIHLSKFFQKTASQQAYLACGLNIEPLVSKGYFKCLASFSNVIFSKQRKWA